MKDYEKLLNTGLKEIDVITGTFECAMIDQMNISNIEDMYMVESVSDGVDKVKEFFKKMIEAFKNTLKKIKEAIQNKIQQVKLNHAVDKISKAGIKDIEKIANKGYANEKQLSKYLKEEIKLTQETIKGIIKAKSIDEAEDIMSDGIRKEDRIRYKFESDIQHDKFITVGEFKTMATSMTMYDLLQTHGDIIDKLDDIYIKKMKEFAKAESEEEMRRKAEEVPKYKKAAQFISKTYNKCANVVSKHKMAAIVTLAGLAASIGGKKAYDKFGKGAKEVSESTEFELDAMLDDMVSEMTVATEATRYAKEMHKKADQAEDDVYKYGIIKNTTNSETVKKNANSKIQEALNNYKDADFKDSLGILNQGGVGKIHAKRQPGRYEKTKERKPNKYKEMYDKKNKK
jgi:hypothetical protein